MALLDFDDELRMADFWAQAVPSSALTAPWAKSRAHGPTEGRRWCGAWSGQDARYTKACIFRRLRGGSGEIMASPRAERRLHGGCRARDLPAELGSSRLVTELAAASA